MVMVTQDKQKSINQQSAAVYNRLLIIKLLRKHRQLTRTQLAEYTQLQNSTMSYIIRDFINRGIVIESGKRESGAGNKKQTYLRSRTQKDGVLVKGKAKTVRVIISSTIVSWPIYIYILHIRYGHFS